MREAYYLWQAGKSSTTSNGTFSKTVTNLCLCFVYKNILNKFVYLDVRCKTKTKVHISHGEVSVLISVKRD